MNEKVAATLKSSETEDWLDYHFVRPLSYYWAVLFARLDIHPNTVTLISWIIGAGSAYFFAFSSFYYDGWHGLMMNVIAIVLLIWADIYDCTDGQLARMTGKKSQLGRILDGAAGFVWFIPIYLALVYRFYLHHSIEFSLFGIAETEQNVQMATCVVLILSFISGFDGIGAQQRLADYYIQIHLLFQKGKKGSELDTSAQQKKLYDETPWKGNFLWKVFLHSYVGYTKKQEKQTPQFQRLMRVLAERYGDDIPEDIRQELHKRSLAIIPLNGMLTFNFRTGMFIIFCLADIPALYFIFESVGMRMFTNYINYRHESFCREIADRVVASTPAK
jgi:phosphatidylglycerophosphate synthase